MKILSFLRRNLVSSVSLALSFLIVVTSLVLADNLENDVVTDPASITLTAGGSSYGVEFYVQATGGDTDPQCNFDTTSEELRFTINVPTGVTANPSTLTFNKCHDGSNKNGQTVQFSADASAASGYISFTQTFNNSGGTFNYADAVFYINVTTADSTPPVITPSISGTLGSNGWYVSDVTVSWTVTDLESTITSKTGCDPVTLSSDTAGVTYTCAATSSGGTASQSVTIKRDATAPTITPSVSPALPASGWYNIASGAPTVSFTCSDGMSGLAGVCPSPSTFGEGEDLFRSETIYDNAGNSASAGVSNIDVDLTAPTIKAIIGTPDGSNGWYITKPTVSFECSDATSKINTCPADYEFSEGADQSHTGTAYDIAGNSASDGVSSIYVDLTKPSITWDIPINDGDSFYFGFVPTYPPNPCIASDELSGPADCSVTAPFTTVGDHTLTATAYDMAGNSTVETRSYTVNAWLKYGFYSPVDMFGVLNVVKAGSTVPLKFEIFAATELTDTSYINPITATKVTCDLSATQDTINAEATGGTELRYDWTAGQFIYNWKVPKASPGTCYRVTVSFMDGGILEALFKTK